MLTINQSCLFFFNKVEAFRFLRHQISMKVARLYSHSFPKKTIMRKHFHLIGHFLKNAQSSENMYEIFFGPLKNAQLSENACPYPRASILT